MSFTFQPPILGVIGATERSYKSLSVRPASPPAGTKSNAPHFSKYKSRHIANPACSGTVATRVELRQKYNMADIAAGDGSHFLSTGVSFNFRSPNNILLHVTAVPEFNICRYNTPSNFKPRFKFPRSQ